MAVLTSDNALIYLALYFVCTWALIYWLDSFSQREEEFEKRCAQPARPTLARDHPPSSSRPELHSGTNHRRDDRRHRRIR
jgi:hypothetical protein